MAVVDESWVLDKGMADILWMSRLFGIAPLRFQKTSTSILAYISRPVYYLGVLTTCLLNLLAIVQIIVIPFAAAQDVLKHNSVLLSIVNLILAEAITLYTASISVTKIKRYLYITSELNNIKNSLNYKYNSGHKVWPAFGLVGLFMFERFILIPLSYWVNGEKHILEKMLINVTFYGSVDWMKLHFVFMAFHVNSSYEVINKCLADVLAKISGKSWNRYLSFSKADIRFSNIRITSINRTIDLLGNMKHDENTSPRMKLAYDVRELANSFERTCEVVRHLNDVENVSLLVHVIIITMYLVFTINNLVRAANDTTDLKYALVGLECIWLLLHTFKIILLVQPCHGIQEELSQTKMFVAHIMCKVINEADPLLDATDNFLKQLHLNEVSISVMGMFCLERSIISTIIGGATTLYVILLEM